jgi:hypothetical protein
LFLIDDLERIASQDPPEEELTPRLIHHEETFFDPSNPNDPIVVVNEYELFGRIRVESIVQPDPCESLLAAFNAAVKHLKGIDATIAGLQADLKTASPGEKPGIIKEIKRLKTVERPPAVEAVATTRAAYEKCSGGFRFVSSPVRLRERRRERLARRAA